MVRCIWKLADRRALHVIANTVEEARAGAKEFAGYVTEPDDIEEVAVKFQSVMPDHWVLCKLTEIPKKKRG